MVVSLQWCCHYNDNPDYSSGDDIARRVKTQKYILLGWISHGWHAFICCMLDFDIWYLIFWYFDILIFDMCIFDISYSLCVFTCCLVHLDAPMVFKYELVSRAAAPCFCVWTKLFWFLGWLVGWLVGFDLRSLLPFCARSFWPLHALPALEHI